jgi:hypothetical protein
MIDIIKEEINKENPDWLLISNLSKKIYHQSNKPKFLGIRENMINHVKVGKYCDADVTKILKYIFPEICIIQVGTYGDSVPVGITKIKEHQGETIIVVNEKDALVKHLGVHQSFRCSINGKIRWTDVDTGLVTIIDNLSALLRDYKISEILKDES